MQGFEFDISPILRDLRVADVGGVKIPYPGIGGIQDIVKIALTQRKFDVPAGELPEPHGTTNYGLPYWFPITLQSRPGGYWKYKSGKLEQVDMADLRLPLTSVCRFSRIKDSSTTRVSGDGSGVTEIYGFMPWQIEINGVILPEPGQPQGLTELETMLRELVSWDDVADSIEVLGDQFAWRGIEQIHIQSITVDQERARRQAIPYTIMATSDKQFELS